MKVVKKIKSSAVLCVFLTSGLLYSAPPTYKLGASLYNDDLEPVIGDLADSIGNIEGLSSHAFYRKAFYNNLFFYRGGISIDYAFPKKVDNFGTEYTLSQYRMELPFVIGASQWTARSRIYLGAGFSFNYYQLDIVIEDKFEQQYTALGISSNQVLGILVDYTKKTQVYLELNWLEASMKGEYKAGKDKIDLFINPKYQRVYFGISRKL